MFKPENEEIYEEISAEEATEVFWYFAVPIKVLENDIEVLEQQKLAIALSINVYFPTVLFLKKHYNLLKNSKMSKLKIEKGFYQKVNECIPMLMR